MGNIKVIKPETDFEQIPGAVIREFDVTTIGVYNKLLCLGDSWTLNVKGLASLLDLSQDKVRKAITTLEKAGYIVRRTAYEGNRLKGWEYIIYGNCVPEEERTRAGLSNFSVTENQTSLKSDKSENDQDNIYILKSINKLKSNNTLKESKFSFLSSLLSIGVEKTVAEDWLAVRKTKKATNTQTAFNRVKKQIELSGLEANECIRIAVERSWSGFEAEWLKSVGLNQPNTNNTKNAAAAPVDEFERMLEEKIKKDIEAKKKSQQNNGELF